MWEKQIEALQKNYYCIAYDIRGLGQSDVGDGQYTMEMYVDDLFSIIEELKLKKTIYMRTFDGGDIFLYVLLNGNKTDSKD